MLRQYLASTGRGPDSLACGYGDSAADIPMLLMCRERVLVNPARGLQKRLPDARIVTWR